VELCQKQHTFYTYRLSIVKDFSPHSWLPSSARMAAGLEDRLKILSRDLRHRRIVSSAGLTVPITCDPQILPLGHAASLSNPYS
jgi:hypothetical protein